MIRIANKDARKYVERQEPFKGSNLTGFNSFTGSCYIVCSYNWYPIFVCKDNQWYENEDKYSKTTSKQTTLARPNCGNITELPYDEIKKLY